MVWPCKQNASEKVSQTSFICETKREKAGGTTTNTLARLHWGFRMEPLGASTKRYVGGGGRPWCVADQSWAAAPATLTDMSGYWKKIFLRLGCKSLEDSLLNLWVKIFKSWNKSLKNHTVFQSLRRLKKVNDLKETKNLIFRKRRMKRSWQRFTFFRV